MLKKIALVKQYCRTRIIYQEIIQYLEYARNSAFENANIAILMNRRGLISKENKQYLLDELDKLCRKITTLQKSLTR